MLSSPLDVKDVVKSAPEVEEPAMVKGVLLSDSIAASKVAVIIIELPSRTDVPSVVMDIFCEKTELNVNSKAKIKVIFLIATKLIIKNNLMKYTYTNTLIVRN